MLSGSRYGVVGCSDLTPASQSFHRFGFTSGPVERLDSTAAQTRYALTGPTRQQRLAAAGSATGGHRLVETPFRRPWGGEHTQRTGGHAVDVYPRDLTATAAALVSADIGLRGPARYDFGGTRLALLAVVDPDGQRVVVLSSDRRRASGLDYRAVLHSDASAYVFCCSDPDAATAWWTERGAPDLLPDDMLPEPAVADPVGLPRGTAMRLAPSGSPVPRSPPAWS